MGAAQVGYALHQFESGDTKGGALTLGILGTTTAIGTKVPGANLVQAWRYSRDYGIFRYR